MYNSIVWYCLVHTRGRIFGYYAQQYKYYLITRGRTALYVWKTWRPTLRGSPRDDRALWEPSSPFHTKLEQSHLMMAMMIMMIWYDFYIYLMMILYDIIIMTMIWWWEPFRTKLANPFSHTPDFEEHSSELNRPTFWKFKTCSKWTFLHWARKLQVV